MRMTNKDYKHSILSVDDKAGVFSEVVRVLGMAILAILFTLALALAFTRQGHAETRTASQPASDIPSPSFLLVQYAPGYQPQMTAPGAQSQPPQALPGPSSGYNQDVAYARQAQTQAATSLSGQSITWRNPQTGTSGTEWATGAPVSNGQGQLCRQVQEVIVIGGQAHRNNGLLCFPPNYFH